MSGPVRLPTALVGFGRISRGYAADPAMARYFPYASHAQVLRDHPSFAWTAVVDPDAEAREAARVEWSVPTVAPTVAELGSAAENVQIAVLATPPHARLRVLDDFPKLRAVLVEKPLGDTLADAHEFVAACERRGILVQVNLWRRADEWFRALGRGELERLIGAPQCCAGFYGNGLLNNGTHMVDFTRMLLGDVVSVQRLATAADLPEGPIPGDTNPGFALGLSRGAAATFLPLSFRKYRENGLTIWGERGRIDVLNEGLTLRHYPIADNRAMTGEHEIACDGPLPVRTTVGMALYHMYTNLAECVAGIAPLCSPASSALVTTRVVEAIRTAPSSGEQIMMPAHS